jgi:hypothetical protein
MATSGKKRLSKRKITSRSSRLKFEKRTKMNLEVLKKLDSE